MWAFGAGGGGGSKQQTGLQFVSLPACNDKVLISMGPLSLATLPAGSGAPSVVLTPPPFTTNTQPTLHFYHGADAV